jgi:hypothetical protein
MGKSPSFTDTISMVWWKIDRPPDILVWALALPLVCRQLSVPWFSPPLSVDSVGTPGGLLHWLNENTWKCSA